jgi:hypothetical protein
VQPDVTGRLGRFDRDTSGGYSIYDKNGDRIGVGKPRSDGSIDLYDTGLVLTAVIPMGP